MLVTIKGQHVTKKLRVGESWTSRAKLRRTGGKTLRFYEIVKKKSETPEFEFSLR